MLQAADWRERHQPILERLRFDDQHPSLIRPSYDGHGIVNLPWTALDILGVPIDGPPLAPGLLPDAIGVGVRTVLVIIVDALGYRQITRAMEAGDAPTFARLAEQAAFSPLTSTFPSTTVAALTALQTGAPPCQHGLVGYWCYLREFGMLSNLLQFAPVGGFRSYADRGFEPRHFIPVPTIYERAAACGVAVDMVNFRPFRDTALSRMHASAAEFHAYRSLGEFTTLIRRAITVPASAPHLVVAYWPMNDLLGHTHGPDGEATSAELRLLDAALGRELFDQIRRDDLLVLITADHGMTRLDPAKETSLNERPDLLELLRLPPAGERRGVYLHPRPGEEESVRTALAELAGEDGTVLAGPDLIDMGLFGPEPVYAEVPYRVGDLVLLASGPSAFPYNAPGEAAEPMRGAHGSLDADDMLVPLFAWRP